MLMPVHTVITQYRSEGDTLIFDNIRKARVTQLTSHNLNYNFSDSVNSCLWIVSKFHLFK